MSNSNRSPFLPMESNLDRSDGDLLTLQSAEQSIIVDCDGFTIGSSPKCDLILDDATVPALHCTIHQQSGAIWIEADNESMVTINDRPYRRMALRHEDRLVIGKVEFRILIQSASAVALQAETQTEDLSLLTAEELCDRILSEQAMVSEFVGGQRSGWENLLRAIESAGLENVTQGSTEIAATAPMSEQPTLDTLLSQIQELNTAITDRTHELNQQEQAVIESSSLAEATQNQLNEQLDEMLSQLAKDEPPTDLRASA